MQIFFNVHLIADLCCLVSFQFYRQGAFKFCPFCSLMFKHGCFHVKLLTSLASYPFAQECSFAHDKKLFLLLKQSPHTCHSCLKSLEWQHELFTTINQLGAFLGIYRPVCFSLTRWVPAVLKFLLTDLPGKHRQDPEDSVPFLCSLE